MQSRARLEGILLSICGAVALLGTLLPWATFTDDFGNSLSQDLYQLGPANSPAFFATVNGSTAVYIAMVLVGSCWLLLIGISRVFDLRRLRWIRSPLVTLPGPILVLTGGIGAWRGSWWLVPAGEAVRVDHHALGAILTLLAAAGAVIPIGIDVLASRRAFARSRVLPPS